VSLSRYKVWLVVDPAFGERLTLLPVDQPVWIVDSAVNVPVMHRLRSERRTGGHLTGITSFVGAGSSNDDVLEQIDSIDLHHGVYSADPPYSEIEVIGAAPSDEVIRRLEELGFRVNGTTAKGFTAVRVG
jgi:hypothetical protein